MHKQLLPDSTISQLREKSVNDSVNKLDSLANNLKVTDHIMADHFANLALFMAMKTNSTEALAKAYLTKGILFNIQNSDSAYFYFRKSLRIAYDFKFNHLTPYILYDLSMLALSAVNTGEAVILLDSTVNSAEKVHDFATLSNAFNTLGNIKMDAKDFEGARIMYDNAYRIADENILIHQKGVALASLAKLESDPYKSVSLQRKAIDLLKKQKGTEEEIARILINLGLISPNSDTSIMCYKSAIAMISGKYPDIEIAAYNNLAYSFLEKKDYSNAENCLTEHAIPIAVKIDNIDWLSTLYDSYAELLHVMNRNGEAYAYEKKAMEARLQADIRQASGQVRLLAAQLDSKNQQLRIQEKEKELMIRQHKISRMQIWVGLIIVIFITLLLLLWQSMKVRLHAQKIKSARTIIGLEESLKGRLAMEIHDLVRPLNTSIARQLDSVEFPDPRLKNEIKDKLSGITEGIRQISHRLNRVFIEQFTFNELIKGLCEDMQALTQVRIYPDISEGITNLTEESITHIYRIIQELLDNAIKNLQTGIIDLTLSQEMGKIFIFYHDNGPGFDPTLKEVKGLGILNIKERAILLGGSAELIAQPGLGTQWIIQIPVSKNTKM